MKLRYVLPPAQIALAIVMLVWSQAQDRAAMRFADMPGPAPAVSLLMSLNAPLTSIRIFWYQYLPYWLDSSLLITAIGLFWYWVALNISSWRGYRTVRTFSYVPMRLIADLILISIGLEWAFIAGRGTARPFSLRFDYPGSPWFIPCIGLQLAWSLLLVWLFARDFVLCLLRKR